MPKTAEDLRRMPPFEFENWAVLALEGVPNRVKTHDLGIDGRIYPAELQKKKSLVFDMFGAKDAHWFPIQVKQRDKVGRPDIDAFETAMRRDFRTKGYFVAFDFTDGAVKEINRVAVQEGLEIVPLTVNDLLKFEKAVG